MKKTRILALLLAAVMSFTLLSGSVSAAKAVTDIKGHWAEEIIARWIDAEKISGYTDGTFKPDNSVTRAEFAKILAGVIPSSNPTVTEKHEFSDVAATDWFYSYVTHLYTIGVVAKADAFYPGSPITRQDAVTMIGRAFYIESNGTAPAEGFADYADISEYAKKYLVGFLENEYISGYPDNTIRPKNPITRAESLKILDKIVEVFTKDSLEGIMERIYAGVPDFAMRVGNVRISAENSEYFLGLKSIDQIEEAIASDSLIGSQAHSVALVRAKEGADVAALMEQIRTSVNPRKWICVGVEREDIIMKNQGNLILMVIDQHNPKAIADSFMALDLIKKPTLVPDADKLLFTDGFYMDYIGELRPNSVVKFANKVEKLTDKYLKNSTGVFYSVIPSKTYFVNDRVETPFDYDTMQQLLRENIKSAKYIDLFGALKMEDYYKTDPHWRQENLQPVVDALGAQLGFKIDLKKNTATELAGFKGQHGYKKEGFPTENLSFLTNAAIDGAVVSNMENEAFKKIYNVDKFKTDSPYDLFLSGPSSLETITNEAAATDKELIIFRDSYSSSLAPLLCENYKKITLIDIRYIMSALLGEYVNFDGKDVLFLYNEQIINYSEMLK